MARPNKQRAIGARAAVADNVRHFRVAAGMTPAGLAERMAQRGCPINVSAIYKIEKDDRTVDPDELVALAEVFGVPVPRLLVIEEAGHRDPETTALVLAYASAVRAVEHAKWEAGEAEEKVLQAETEWEELLSQLNALDSITRETLLRQDWLPSPVRLVLKAPGSAP